MTDVQAKLNEVFEIPILIKGNVYKTDSNLGGVFKIKFLHQEKITGIYHFENVSPGFEGAIYTVKPSQINIFLIQ